MKDTEYHVKTKDYFIKNVNSNITLISHLLRHARDLVTSMESEEDNYKRRNVEGIIKEEETTMLIDKKEAPMITNDKK
jgi:hypothetical protein